MGGMKDLLGDTPATYPERPGYKEHTTSRDAARQVAPRAGAVRGEVLEALRQRPNGATADELAEAIGRSELYVRPRLSELRKLEQIEPTGQRRPNKSGMAATVWRATGQQ